MILYIFYDKIIFTRKVVKRAGATSLVTTIVLSLSYWFAMVPDQHCSRNEPPLLADSPAALASTRRVTAGALEATSRAYTFRTPFCDRERPRGRLEAGHQEFPPNRTLTPSRVPEVVRPMGAYRPAQRRFHFKAGREILRGRTVLETNIPGRAGSSGG